MLFAEYGEWIVGFAGTTHTFGSPCRWTSADKRVEVEVKKSGGEK